MSCRVSTRIKDQAEAAASLRGQSITDFTEQALADRAQAVLERHERIELSERDFLGFVASLGNPAPPTPELKASIMEYRRLREANPGLGL